MIITCPSCDKKFNVDASLIPKVGRNLQCGFCDHKWFYTLPKKIVNDDVLELDDTPDKERIHLYHRKGTRVEVDKDGNYIEKVVKDKYSVILGDDTVTISGKVTVNITGDADISVGGKTNITSVDDITMIAPKIKLNG